MVGSEKGVGFAAVGRRRDFLIVEERVRDAEGGKCKLLNGKSKARDGICPVLCMLLREFVCW